jgi:hypothetical protein
MGGAALGGGDEEVEVAPIEPIEPMDPIEPEEDGDDAECVPLAAQPLTNSTAAPATNTRNLTDTPLTIAV